MTSLCDVCFEPGHCCKELIIAFADGETLNYEILTLANVRMAMQGFPFIATGHAHDGQNVFMCPLLDGDGYCSDYKNRPKLCRKYEPASDGLCVFYEAPME